MIAFLWIPRFVHVCPASFERKLRTASNIKSLLPETKILILRGALMTEDSFLGVISVHDAPKSVEW